jgi:hypothetical protein
MLQDFETNPEFQSVMEGMVNQMISKDVLYEPMKELREKVHLPPTPLSPPLPLSLFIPFPFSLLHSFPLSIPLFHSSFSFPLTISHPRIPFLPNFSLVSQMAL